MPRITSKDRAEEYNRLIVEQGHATRSVKYGWKPDPSEKAVIDTRAARLIELCELLGAHKMGADINDPTMTPEREVNERIAAWLRHNQLALTNQRMLTLLEENVQTNNPDKCEWCGQSDDKHENGCRFGLGPDEPDASTGNVCGVTIQIGEGDKAYHYSVMADDFVALHGGGRVLFRVPESIAEFFRQQGRRQLQRAIQRELGL